MFNRPKTTGKRAYERSMKSAVVPYEDVRHTIQQPSKLKGAFGKYWNKKSGIQPYGLGKAATGIGVVSNLYGIGKGLSDLSDTRNETDDIASDIVTASYNNPMLQYDLDENQMKLLRQLRRGTYDSDSDIDWSDTIGGALKGGVYGLAGGIPGVILGALGGGANAAIDSMNTAQGVTNDELEALYAAIMQSEQEYNALRKQRMIQSGIY